MLEKIAENILMICLILGTIMLIILSIPLIITFITFFV